MALLGHPRELVLLGAPIIVSVETKRKPRAKNAHSLGAGLHWRVKLGQNVPFRTQQGPTMILGMSIETFTLVHVVLSLIGILAGFVVVFGMFASRLPSGWTGLFLATTILTSVTGYFFPRDHILPSHIVGAISLVLLAFAVFALYSKRLAGSWRWIFVVTVVASLYLNVFVAVFQAFLKVPAIHALAPTQAEPPFMVAQVAVLVLFIVFGVFAVRRFHPR
jgi:hypothetical protein